MSKKKIEQFKSGDLIRVLIETEIFGQVESIERIYLILEESHRDPDYRLRSVPKWKIKGWNALDERGEIVFIRKHELASGPFEKVTVELISRPETPAEKEKFLLEKNKTKNKNKNLVVVPD